MMTKTQRVTDKLNIAIATISAASKTGHQFIDSLPDSKAKQALLICAQQIDDGVSDAYTQLRAIRKSAEAI